MKWIVFSGIDGCGKSSVIAGVEENLSGHGLTVSVQWLRFHHVFCRVLHAFARCVGLSRKQAMTEGGAWRHEFYRSRLFCACYVWCTYFDTCLGRRRVFRCAAAEKADVVLCDRWIPDILVDLAVACRNPEILDGPWAARFMKLLPPDTLLLGISRPECDLLACRSENREDKDFEFRLDMYRLWMTHSGTAVIENDSDMESAVSAALDCIGKLLPL